MDINLTIRTEEPLTAYEQGILRALIGEAAPVAPAKAEEPAPAPAKAEEPAPAPAKAEEPAPAPAKAEEPAPAPAKAEEPTPAKRKRRTKAEMAAAAEFETPEEQEQGLNEGLETALAKDGDTEEATATTGVTLQDALNEATALMTSGGRNKVLAALKDVGVARVRDMDGDAVRIAAFLKAIRG